MINASERFKQNAKAPVKTVQMRMTQVVSEGETPLVYSSADLIKTIKIEASSTWLYSGAKKATVTLVDTIPSLLNYAWVVELGIIDPTTSEIDYITLGTFVTDKVDVSYEKGTTTLALYDYMSKADKAWQDNTHTNYPKTVGALANGIATNIGCDGLEDMTGLPNVDQIVQEDLWALISQEKYRDVINEIANITASTAIVNSRNYLEFVPFRYADEALTYDNLKKYKLGLPYGKVNSVVLSRQPQNDDVAQSDNISINENGLTEIKIVNNEIADDDRPSYITPLFNKLNGISFNGIEMDTEGHGWYEIGDSLLVGEGKSRLPEEYQEVSFLESTGTQYINTGYIYNASDVIEMTISPLEASADKAIFGSYEVVGGSACVCELGILSSQLRGNIGSAGSGVDYTAGQIYSVRYTSGRWSYNGTNFGNLNSNNGTVPAFVFGRNYGDNRKESIARVYSIKITRDGSLIHNFVPSVRVSDGVAGLYDTSTGVFHTNSGTGELKIGDIVNGNDELPSEYQEVEYIESAQTQWIDTGVHPQDIDTMEADITLEQLRQQQERQFFLGGNYDSSSTTSGVASYVYVVVESRMNNQIQLWYGTYRGTPSYWTLGERKKIKTVLKKGLQQMYVDGEIVLNNSTAHEPPVSSRTLPLMAYNYKDNTLANYGWGGRVYSLKLSKEGVMVRDFVPCYRRSDGVAGLYDRITGTFYTNAGTGSFTVGADVNKTIVVTDLSMTLDGGGFKETIKCVTPNLTSTDYTATGGIKKSIWNTEIKTDKQQQEITSIVSRQDTFENQVNEEFTQVYQNIEGLTVSVQTTGGGNYIKNSVGYSKDTDNNLINWAFAGSGNYSSQTSPESMQAGAISGNQISLFNGTLTQRIVLAPNIKYVLSYIGKKSITGIAGVIIRNDNGQQNLLMPDQHAVYWEKQEITFTPTLGYVDVIITANADVTEFAITDLMLSQGDLSTPWRQADGEILNTQVAVDTEGIRVKSSVYEGDETVMTPLEFAGYSSVSGSKTKVFSLNRDTTEVQKISVQQQISMPPLKVIPLDNPSGWAFVKEGE